MNKNLLIVSLCSLLLGCSHEEPSENRPSITDISFEGIPQNDVNFDKSNSRIIVKLPAVLENGLRPTIKLSDGARVLSGLTGDNRIDLSSYCQCGIAPDPVTVKVGDGQTTATYELKMIAAGPIKPIETTDQPTFSLKTKKLELSLPVENLYNNTRFTTLHLTNMATGASSLISADGACIAGCSADQPSRITLKLGTPIERNVTPGTYSIRLDNLNFTQKLVVTE